MSTPYAVEHWDDLCNGHFATNEWLSAEKLCDGRTQFLSPVLKILVFVAQSPVKH